MNKIIFLFFVLIFSNLHASETPDAREDLAHRFSGFKEFLDENSINCCIQVGHTEGFVGKQNSGLYKIGEQKYFGKIVTQAVHNQENKCYEKFRELAQNDSELQEVLTLPIAVFLNKENHEVLQIMPFRGSMLFEEFSRIIVTTDNDVLDIAKEEQYFAMLRKVGHAFGVLYRNQIFPEDHGGFCNAGSYRVQEDCNMSFVDCGPFCITKDKKALLQGMYRFFLGYNSCYAEFNFNIYEMSFFLGYVKACFDFMNRPWDRDNYNLIGPEGIFCRYTLHGRLNVEGESSLKTLPSLDEPAEIYNQHEENKLMVDRINSLLLWRSWLRPLFSGFLDSCGDQSCNREIINALMVIHEKANEYKKSPSEWHNVDPDFWTAIFLQKSIEDVVSYIEKRK